MDESPTIFASEQTDFIELTTEIVAAYVSKNSVRPGDLPPLLAEVHGALSGLKGAAASAESKVEKATPSQIRKSITPDALISFIDGKPYKTLKRHLTGAGLTFEEYRERFGLPRDYPTTAANYSAMRAEFARNAGLGTQRRNAAPKAAAADETVAEAPKAWGRKKVVEPTAAPAEKPAHTRKSKKAAAAA
ncbi:MucR family transcriptional regulator [Methylobacterium sp. NPDC080182]|uniref:MucR family transcriptional regulator n=1 Tax=unclassified Methylobacterium TaxID=2615210 RepID=UPI0008A8055D|nr:MucR family transcriptional regulator [Methylobacterium sp. 275MFSha3.1]SEI15677.1 transcriptional regulator, MucR family [Methylobacterium sp. 275MFSha3.1]